VTAPRSAVAAERITAAEIDAAALRIAQPMLDQAHAEPDPYDALGEVDDHRAVLRRAIELLDEEVYRRVGKLRDDLDVGSQTGPTQKDHAAEIEKRVGLAMSPPNLRRHYEAADALLAAEERSAAASYERHAARQAARRTAADGTGRPGGAAGLREQSNGAADRPPSTGEGGAGRADDVDAMSTRPTKTITDAAGLREEIHVDAVPLREDHQVSAAQLRP
jgi:hypothetical protein